jgi:hypothetical protein
MNLNPKTVFLYSFIASVSLSALIGIGVVLFGNFGDLEVRVLLTTLTITVTSILGLACGAYLERKNVPLPLAGIIFAVISAILWLIVIWYRGSPKEWYIKTTVTVTILAYACSHLSLLSLARLEKKFAWIHQAAHFLIWSLAGFSIFVVWAEPDDYNELIARTIGVLAILVAAVTILTPVFHKLSAVQTGADIDAEIEQLKLKIRNLEIKKSQILSNKIEE